MIRRCFETGWWGILIRHFWGGAVSTPRILLQYFKLIVTLMMLQMWKWDKYEWIAIEPTQQETFKVLWDICKWICKLNGLGYKRTWLRNGSLEVLWISIKDADHLELLHMLIILFFQAKEAINIKVLTAYYQLVCKSPHNINVNCIA